MSNILNYYHEELWITIMLKEQEYFQIKHRIAIVFGLDMTVLFSKYAIIIWKTWSKISYWLDALGKQNLVFSCEILQYLSLTVNIATDASHT